MSDDLTSRFLTLVGKGEFQKVIKEHLRLCQRNEQSKRLLGCLERYGKCSTTLAPKLQLAACGQCKVAFPISL